MASGNAFVLVPILWAVVAVGWAPMLLSERLRGLCARWPTGRVVLNYPLVVTVVVITHVVLFLAVVIDDDIDGLLVVLDAAQLGPALGTGYGGRPNGRPRIGDGSASTRCSRACGTPARGQGQVQLAG